MGFKLRHYFADAPLREKSLYVNPMNRLIESYSGQVGIPFGIPEFTIEIIDDKYHLKTVMVDRENNPTDYYLSETGLGQGSGNYRRLCLSPSRDVAWFCASIEGYLMAEGYLSWVVGFDPSTGYIRLDSKQVVVPLIFPPIWNPNLSALRRPVLKFE